ncbi:unnamed protein product [Nesidiocoris tenuis]|uniref:Uncharacterized protein n=1 Tax=Nesidiocoris tenuis TaxID=355587 RepID=A0A6H5HAL0_9HEMI|nr:unnamed protein product [Nesidiocoris tenuis]
MISRSLWFNISGSLSRFAEAISLTLPPFSPPTPLPIQGGITDIKIKVKKKGCRRFPRAPDDLKINLFLFCRQTIIVYLKNKKRSLPPSPADSGVSDVDSSSSGHTSNDELRARLAPPHPYYPHSATTAPTSVNPCRRSPDAGTTATQASMGSLYPAAHFLSPYYHQPQPYTNRTSE